MVPKGSHPRLEAVLRAGRAHAARTGADGDNAATKLTGNAAADALKKRSNSVPASKLKAAARAALLTTNGSGGNDPTQDAGAPPVLPARAMTLPAVVDNKGYTIMKGPAPGKKALVNDDGKQIFGKSNPMVEDLVNTYKDKTEERRDQLARARRDAEECAQRRRQAVSDYQQEQEAAADAAIKKLQEELAEKEAMIDDMQNQSNEALKQLQDAKDSGSASSEEVERLLATIATLTIARDSFEKQLEQKVESWQRGARRRRARGRGRRRRHRVRVGEEARGGQRRGGAKGAGPDHRARRVQRQAGQGARRPGVGGQGAQRPREAQGGGGGQVPRRGAGGVRGAQQVHGQQG